MGVKDPSKHAIGSWRSWGSPKEDGTAKEISPGASAQHVEEEAAATEEQRARPGLFKRMWLHYKRYWIWYTIAAVIFLAIFLPVL